MNFKYALILGLIAFISATILSVTYAVTKKPIESAYREDFLTGLRAVLPEFDNQPDADAIIVDGRSIYLAKVNNNLVAFSTKGSSLKGFGGELSLLVGADATGKIIGIYVTQHTETPGLGDRAMSPAFMANFIGKNIDERFILTRDGGDVDQVTGATMTSRAVSDAINNALDLFKGNIEVQK